MTDFIERIQTKDLNKKSLESLAKTGAMDGLGERNQLIANIESILNYSKDFQRNQNSNQISLFSSLGSDSVEMPDISLAPAEPAPKMQRLSWEKELLGLYISDHPLAEYTAFFRQFSKPVSELTSQDAGQTVSLGGIVDKVKVIFLKSQKNMAFISLEDAAGQKIEVIAFPKILERYGGMFSEGNIVLVSGKISDKDGSLKLVCDEARLINQDEIERFRLSETQKKLQEEQEKSLKKIFIRLPEHSDSELFRKVSAILSTAFPGNCKIFLELSSNNSGAVNRLETPYRIDYDTKVAKQIGELLGQNHKA